MPSGEGPEEEAPMAATLGSDPPRTYGGTGAAMRETAGAGLDWRELEKRKGGREGDHIRKGKWSELTFGLGRLLPSNTKRDGEYDVVQRLHSTVFLDAVAVTNSSSSSKSSATLVTPLRARP